MPVVAPSPSGMPLLVGTVVFIILAVVCAFIGFLIGKRGKLFTSHESGLCCFISTGMIFLMWLMWVCMWMMQWHPLVMPYARPSHE